MTSDSYKKLIDAANESIPFYTTFLETLGKLLEVQNNTIGYLLKIDPTVDLEVFNEIEQMNKFNSLITISLLDIMVICKNLCLAETTWERIYFVKQGYLIIYETINTYHKHNRSLQNIVSAKYPMYKTTLESINKDLRQFKKTHDYENVIGQIRNKVAGHIDEDFVLYYNTIKSLNGEQIGQTISHFIPILNRLQDLLKDLVSQANMEMKNKGESINKRFTEQIKHLEELFSKFENHDPAKKLPLT